MSKLRTEIIRLAYKTPELRPHLLPLVNKTSKSMSYEELLNEKVNNPDTDSSDKVLVKTLKNSPRDSGAHKRYLQIKKQWQESEKSEESKKDKEDKEEGDEEENSDETDEKDEKAEEESKNFIKENKGKLKGAINKAKATIKQKFKEFTNHEVSFGELAEMCMGLVVTLFNEKEGEKLLTNLMDTIDARNDKTFKEALSELKAAESSATLSEESKKMMEKIGLDPLNKDTNHDKIKKWLTDTDKDGEPIPDDVMDEILSFFFQITEGHMKFLRLFVSNGEIDLKRLRATLAKGVPDELKDTVEKQKKKDDKEKEESDNEDKKESSIRRVLARTALQNPQLRSHIFPFLFDL